jgi:hypothetical protein
MRSKPDVPKPAAYPKTDFAENEAILVFKSLVDQRYIKDGIQQRDKLPNTDGWLEIVNEDSVPIGKLEIQIRKIKARQKKYDCPIELIGYSRVSTLPFLLICVDTVEKRVFWKLLTPAMPEYKHDQKSFVIHFSENSDTVDQNGIYLQKWQEISREYQKRINELPFIVENNLTLAKIKREDLVWLQKFIGTINGLLSGEFSVVKQILYPGIAEFGVGVFYSGDEGMHFQVYKIPFGQQIPHIIQLEVGSFLSDKTNPNNAVAEYMPRRENLALAEEMGRKFVLNKLSDIVKQKALPVRGLILSEDILFGFIDRYYRCLGLEPNKDTYEVAELDYALNQYLFNICTTLLKRLALPLEKGQTITVELDDIDNILINENLKPLPVQQLAYNFSIHSNKISTGSAYQALSYLLANQIHTIHRPIKKDENLDDIKSILLNSITIYSSFIKENLLYFPKSLYLDWETAIVWEYFRNESGNDAYYDPPILREHHIRAEYSRLPKLSVIMRSTQEKPTWFGDVYKEQTPTIISPEGIKYRLDTTMGTVERGASFLFSETPILNLVYLMLRKDLEYQYNVDLEDPIIG